MLNKYSIFSNELKAEMIGTEGKVALWDDDTVNTIPSNISDPRIVATVAYNCIEEEYPENLMPDYIDTLFDLLLEQIQA